jgi:hypothetical protein
MTREHPLMDAYWDDKVAALDKIGIPVYITAGWNLPLHLQGSIEGFRRIASPQKWLVAHREFEWRYYGNRGEHRSTPAGRSTRISSCR